MKRSLTASLALALIIAIGCSTLPQATESQATTETGATATPVTTHPTATEPVQATPESSPVPPTVEAPAAGPLTEDQIIDQVLRLNTLHNADDLLAELTRLAQAFVNDTDAAAAGPGFNFTKARPEILYFRGTSISTLSMILPLLPGPLTNPNSLQGKLAARLKTEVTNYLLNASYWEWEYATETGAPYVDPANPAISVGWNHRWRVGPHWEKMYALWAYAYYTGDWATLQANWNFIQARYQEGDTSVSDQQRAQMSLGGIAIYRQATNDLANGLIGYVRIAQHLGHTTEANAARTRARAALGAAIDQIDVSWASCPITVSWENDADTMRGEWSPGYNLTPELGRWVNAQARAVAQTRLDEAANAGELRGHWWTGYLNNLSRGDAWGDEDLWGVAGLSHQLFLGRAWMLQESADALRQVKPWHVIMGSTPEHRDMLYLRSLYALITRHADVTWVPAQP